MASDSSGHLESNEQTGVGRRCGNEGTMAEPGVHNATGSMHPAPSLKEAPPTNFPRSRQYDLPSLTSEAKSPGPGSGSTNVENIEPEHYSAHDTAGPGPRLPPPFRKEANDSTVTTTSHATSTSLPPVGVSTTFSGTDPSPTTLSIHPVSAVQDGPDDPDGSEERHTPKTTRRRTGPLNQEQRIKAAIIRKIGACQDCKRRRVSCDPTRMVPFDSFISLATPLCHFRLT